MKKGGRSHDRQVAGWKSNKLPVEISICCRFYDEFDISLSIDFRGFLTDFRGKATTITKTARLHFFPHKGESKRLLTSKRREGIALFLKRMVKMRLKTYVSPQEKHGWSE